MLRCVSVFCPCRFLRHVPVIYVDYPGPLSLAQIYGTFNRAMLRVVPNLRAYADPLTNAMVEFYSMSQVMGKKWCDCIKPLLYRFGLSKPLLNWCGLANCSFIGVAFPKPLLHVF